MHSEVLAIGDELTSGQRLDTNSRWISARLGELGLRVRHHATAGDELEACRDLFRTALGRSDLVVATGGLGPTADDLTREALAAAAGVELVRDEGVLEHIRELFARRGREMPARNEVQALFPEGSRVVPNPHGTAPGIDLQIARAGREPCRVFALPGVPAELREMWEETVGPAIGEMTGGGRVILHRQLKCFGTGESHLEAMLPDLIRRDREPRVGITVSQATITLRITAHAASEAECRVAIAPTEQTIRERLGSLVFGDEEDELQHAVARLLAERGQRLATVEWATGGLLARWLGEAATGEYVGGVVAGDAVALIGALGLPAEMLAGPEASSAATAGELARRGREKLAADLALAVGNVRTGRSGTSGVFHVGVASGGGVVTHRLDYGGHPDIRQVRAAKQALDVLRREMEGRGGGRDEFGRRMKDEG